MSSLAVAHASASGRHDNGRRPVFPSRIDLPNGFRPEGIAIKGKTFFTGSLADGAIYRGDLRTGEGSVIGGAATGAMSVGLDVDRRNRVFAAGGATGTGRVIDGDTGQVLKTYTFVPDPVATPTFINDVVIAGGSAWFTDSRLPFLYRVPLDLGDFQAVSLTGDLKYVAGFNVNGIDATKDGQTLVLVQTMTGQLFTSDHNGVTKGIDLGGESVPGGDGILLEGRTLFVVQNQLNLIARIKLDRQLTSGMVVERIESGDFDVPTTIDRFGDRLYAVNARFRNPPAPALPANAAYWITAVEAGRGTHHHHHHDE
jgi:sugar lactone lactonase YvrE